MARITIASLQSEIAALKADNAALRARLAETPVTLDPTRIHIATDPRPENDYEAGDTSALAEYAALHCGLGRLPRRPQGTVVTYFTKTNGERWMRTRTGNRSVLTPCA